MVPVAISLCIKLSPWRIGQLKCPPSEIKSPQSEGMTFSHLSHPPQLRCGTCPNPSLPAAQQHSFPFPATKNVAALHESAGSYCGCFQSLLETAPRGSPARAAEGRSYQEAK